HRVYETHPIVNSQLIYYLGHGRVRPVPDVARFHRDAVELASGETIRPDLVGLAGGYLPRFVFQDARVLGIEDGRPHLALHMFGRHPTLAVAGLLQPDAGLFPLVHWQTVMLARWLRLRSLDPDRAGAVWSWLGSQAGKRWSPARSKYSTRHWFEVNHVRYLAAVGRALQRLEVKCGTSCDAGACTGR